MRKLLFFILMLFGSMALIAQKPMTNVGILTIEDSTIVSVKGSLYNLPGGIIDNAGTLVISDSLSNTSSEILFNASAGSYGKGLGTVILNGTSPQVVSGTNGIAFTKLILNNPASLKVETDIWANDSLILQAGSILLDNSDLTFEEYSFDNSLIHSGLIFGENELNRIYGSTGRIIVNNYSLPDTTVNVANIGFIVSPDDEISGFTVVREHNYYDNITDTSIYKSFRVADTFPSGFKAILGLKYLDRDFENLSSTGESNFKLWYSADNGLSFTKIPGSVNTLTNIVSAEDSIFVSAGIYTISDETCDVLPIADISGNAEICRGNDLLLNASQDFEDGNRYLWSSPDINLSSVATTSYSLNLLPESLEGYTNLHFYLKVTNQKGCENFDTVEVKIKKKPDVSIYSTASNYCVGQTVVFTASPGMDEYIWNSGTGVQSNLEEFTYSYANEGQYNVTLAVDSAGCENSGDKTINVFALPEASFTAQNLCAGQIVEFSNTSVINSVWGGAFYTADWDFGDGSTYGSTFESEVSHTYDSSGDYSVKLVVRTSSGCTDSITQTISISQISQADFSVDDVCFGDSCIIINSSDIVPGVVFSWSLGDGTTAVAGASSPNLSHFYMQAGNYELVLTTLTGSDCSDTHTEFVNVFEAASASFATQNVCLGEQLSVENLSQAGNTYEWNFGDGSPVASDLNPVHTYANQGTYEISLVVTTPNFCTDTAIAFSTVNPLPSASFSVTDVCLGDTSFFVNTSVNDSGNLYFWSFGDSQSISTDNSQPDTYYVYTQPGIYSSVLVAQNVFSCRDTATNVIEVKPLPVIPFNTLISTCTGSYLLNAENDGSDYQWSTGEITQSVLVDNDGFYTVTVTNPLTGCANEKTTEIILNSNVVVNLGQDLAVCDFIELDAGYFSAFLWSTGESSQHINITQSGTYFVQVADINSCIGTDTVSIVVNYSPEVSLCCDTTLCFGNTVSFDAQNQGASYLWSNGAETQTITVSTSGSYYVSVTSPDNCSSVSQPVSVLVNDLPVLPFVSDSITACNSIVLNALNQGSEYYWNTGETSQLIEITQSGNYAVSITNAFNCYSEDSVFVIMNYIEPIVLGNDTSICEGNFVILNENDDSDNCSYHWNNGASSHSISVAGAGNWWVVKSDTNGCSVSDTINVTVKPSPYFDLGDDLFLCSADGLELSSPINSDEYAWYKESEFVSSEKDLIIDEPGQYYLYLTNNYNCSYFDSVYVEATPYYSEPQFLVKSNAQAGDTLQFVNLSFPEPDAYFWSFGDGVISHESDPYHTYYMERTFNVVFETVYGNCRTHTEKQIVISGFNKFFMLTQDTALHYNEIIDFVSASLYPNPNKGSFYLELELTQNTDIHVFVYDSFGRVLFQEIYKNSFYVYEFLDFQRLQPGMYFVKSLAGDKSRMFKFIVN